jgi:glycosyltransferase involved in cell wall biosynthesis/peptidoglycan/xylan/chitin deacetylase (PgdA/CDA1 family)
VIAPRGVDVSRWMIFRGAHSMKPVIVTTSWDDGHKLDLKLAGLLKQHGIQATFYVSPHTREFPAPERLTAEEIRRLAEDFEIGAHTMTHPHLDRLSPAAARREIAQSKEMLERIIGKPLRSFCYPYGHFNEETKRLVSEAGFSRARSVKRFMTRSVDPLALGTSVDTFDHRRDGMVSVLDLCGRRPWRAFHLRRWDNLAKEVFAQARERGEVFHLWGHSREIEAHDDWQRLAAFLAWLHEQGVDSVCNADVPVESPNLLVTAPYFKPRSGGVEEYTYQIAKGLRDARNWRVTVVASGDRDEVARNSYHGLKVYHLPYWLKISNTPFGFGWRRALKQIMAIERPDVVVAHAPVPGMADVTARRSKRVPFVVTYHHDSMVKGKPWPDVPIRFYEALVLPRALRRARRIICCSAFVQNCALVAPYIDKTTVINPGVDTNLFVPGPDRAAGRRIMHIGGLKAGERYKGLEISLRVTSELRHRYPDVRLAVVGHGDRLPYYEKLAEKLGIAKHVEFCGKLSGHELVSAYQDADVLIVPSSKESFGMVILEAMACGVPPIASATGGIPEVVEDGEFGFLAEPGNISGFAKKISEMFDDATMAERFSRNARQAALALEYAWPQHVERTAQLLEALL